MRERTRKKNPLNDTECIPRKLYTEYLYIQIDPRP